MSGVYFLPLICCVLVSLRPLYSSEGAISKSFVSHSGHTATPSETDQSMVVKSMLHCASLCLVGINSCKGFNYDEEDKTCDLHAHICAIGGSGFIESDVNSTVNTNLALGKPAEMSSDLGPSYDYAGYVASVGNDGVYHRTATHDGYDDTGVSLLFHTNTEQDPWWRVDLEENYCVSSVYFLNRGFELWQRTKNVVITVALLQTDLDDKVNNMCGEVIGEADRWDNLVTCSLPLIGRYVQLKCEAMTAFHLYEVEVHGY